MRGLKVWEQPPSAVRRAQPGFPLPPANQKHPISRRLPNATRSQPLLTPTSPGTPGRRPSPRQVRRRNPRPPAQTPRREARKLSPHAVDASRTPPHRATRHSRIQSQQKSQIPEVARRLLAEERSSTERRRLDEERQSIQSGCEGDANASEKSKDRSLRKDPVGRWSDDPPRSPAPSRPQRLPHRPTHRRPPPTRRLGIKSWE